MSVHFALFDTAIGRCGIAWGEGGISAVQLPEASDDATRSRLTRRRPSASESPLSANVGRAVADIAALLQGKRVDLSTIVLDMDGISAFDRRVFELTRDIPIGRTSTYGEIAARLGDPRSARAVGTALGHNPLPIIVPCHRVLSASGTLGGFSAHGGLATKRRMLMIERALLELDL
jgi:methylated-DNA-[protein]-cysteine S-methyltransferase